jgi:hypothetical protein
MGSVRVSRAPPKHGDRGDGPARTVRFDRDDITYHYRLHPMTYYKSLSETLPGHRPIPRKPALVGVFPQF